MRHCILLAIGMQKRGRESFFDNLTVNSLQTPPMPRRPRLAARDLVYHLLNRRVGRLPLFETPADYAAFEKILAEA